MHWKLGICMKFCVWETKHLSWNTANGVCENSAFKVLGAMSFSPQSPCQGNAGTPLKQPKEQTASGNTSSHSSETNSLKTNTIQSTCASPEIDPAGKISAVKEKQSEHQHILQKNPDSHISTALQTKPSFTLENVKRFLGFFIFNQQS